VLKRECETLRTLISYTYRLWHFRLGGGPIALSTTAGVEPMIEKHMPSPVGHALAGVAVAWAADLAPGRRAWRTADRTASLFARSGGTLTLVCGALAAAPDLDLIFLSRHRAITHSLGAVITTFIVATAVTGWVTRLSSRGLPASGLEPQRRPVLRIGLMCAAAYGSHLFLDWLAVDTTLPYGLQALWPFSDRWYISGLDLFPGTERRDILSLTAFRTNLIAVSYEAAMLLPVLGLVWLVRVKTLAGLATEPAGRHHAS
jgi:inner membrane protein